jgi:hypothetical protein
MDKSIILALIFLFVSQILLVSSQSTTIESQINNRPCNLDSDCLNNPKNETISDLRSGNFMCINNSCKFVVTAGKLFFSFSSIFFLLYDPDPYPSNSFLFIYRSKL